MARRLRHGMQGAGVWLLAAIDVASEMIAKADLRGDGYEKKEGS